MPSPAADDRPRRALEAVPQRTLALIALLAAVAMNLIS